MLKGFAAFIMRGNVVDLAIAVVIGAAFGSVVTAFVKDLVTPVIAAVIGKPDFSTLSFTINGSRFAIGDFINAGISFILIAAVAYYLIVVPMNAVTGRLHRSKGEPTTRACPECLTLVPLEARRCAACTSPIAPAHADATVP